MPDTDLTSVIENAVATAIDVPDDVSASDADDSSDTPDNSTGADDAVADPVADPATAVPADPAVAVVPAEPSADDLLNAELEALGLNPVPDEQNHRMPYKRVRAIVGNAIKRAAEKHGATAKEHTDWRTQAEQQIASWERAEQLARDNPDQFMARMAESNPAYKRYVDAIAAAAAQGNGHGPAATTAPAIPEAPKPDVQLSDGSWTYSEKGWRAYGDWQKQQLRAEIQKENDERFGPIERDWKQARIMRQLVPHIQTQAARARAWPGWNQEVEDAVTAAMAADQGLTVAEAYVNVVMPKMNTDRTKMRESILAELNATAKRTPTTTAAAASTIRKSSTGGEPRKLEDVIKEAVDGAGLRG